MWEPMLGSSFGLTALLYLMAQMLLLISTMALIAAVIIYIIQSYQQCYSFNTEGKAGSIEIRACSHCRTGIGKDWKCCPNCGREVLEVEPKEEQETDKADNTIEYADPVKSADIIDKANVELSTIITGEEQPGKSKKRKNTKNA